eukprot:gene937-9845_t
MSSSDTIMKKVGSFGSDFFGTDNSYEGLSLKGGNREKVRFIKKTCYILLEMIKNDVLTSLQLKLKSLISTMTLIEKDASNFFKKLSHPEHIQVSLMYLCEVLQDLQKSLQSQQIENILHEVKSEIEILINYHLDGIEYLEQIFLELKKKEKKNCSFRIIESNSFGEDERKQEENEFWWNNFGKLTYCVPKKDFLEDLKKHVKEENWDDIINEIIDPTSDNMVSVSDFKIFLRWFGPLSVCMTNLKDLGKQNYFYGCLSTIESQRLLDIKKQGTYLVRFDEKNVGQFIISCVDESQTENVFTTIHFRVFSDADCFFLSPDENISNHISDLIKKYPMTFRVAFNDDEVRFAKVSALQNNDPSISFFASKKRMFNFTHFRGKQLSSMLGNNPEDQMIDLND